MKGSRYRISSSVAATLSIVKVVWSLGEEGEDLAYSGNGSRNSASPKVELGEFYEDGPRLNELDEQLGESYEDCMELAELFFKLGESYELSQSKRGLSVEVGELTKLCAYVFQLLFQSLPRVFIESLNRLAELTKGQANRERVFSEIYCYSLASILQENDHI
uniref:Uncharacterized protein n=1 Tax=Lactuca sativa TaxID=4236 RepID=A0A9R1XBP6_LACSA|nr:hypothetical protein LSAT_V11C500282620 [Lactuca sativa]